MSAPRPNGQNTDMGRTPFGQCMDAVRTPRARVPAWPRAGVPTRPDPYRPESGLGLLPPTESNSPSPYPATAPVEGKQCACARDCDCAEAVAPMPARRSDWTTEREVWHHLTAGLAMLTENDHGRPWSNPNRAAIRRLCSEHPDDLCVRAANEARQIVIVQDRAPNVTGLFEKKLLELAERRETVRDSLGAA